jgi:hypothetical protein
MLHNFSIAFLAHIIIELFQCCESVLNMNKLSELRISILEGLCCNNTLNIMIKWMFHMLHILEIQC